MIVPGEEQVVVMPPVDEPPGPGPHWTFAKIRRDVRGHDRRHRHREQFHERREGLLERDDDRAIVAHGEAANRLRFLSMEVSRALDRVKKLAR